MESGAGRETVLTIGHSTRTIEGFIEILKAHSVTTIADIRTVPRSRHNPQFNKEVLPASLAAAGIDYRHMVGLGGLRHARSNSPNLGWRNVSFRGYADYMQSEEFEDNLLALVAVADKATTCLMCAEAVPWRCHRSLVADALLVREIRVQHILSKDSVREHVLTPFAKVQGKRITYPPVAGPLS